MRLEFLEVDLVDLVERGANGSVDVEVAAGEYCAGVEELLEDRERPGVSSCASAFSSSLSEVSGKQVRRSSKFGTRPERSLNRSMTAIVLSSRT